LSFLSILKGHIPSFTVVPIRWKVQHRMQGGVYFFLPFLLISFFSSIFFLLQ
jgi:hypothetical protein